MAETGEHPDVVPYNLGDLADVSRATTPSDGDLLRYNATTGEWAPYTRGTWTFTHGTITLTDDTWAAAYTGWTRASQVENLGVNGGDGTFYVDGSGIIHHTGPGLYAFTLFATMTGLDAGDVVHLTVTGDAFPHTAVKTVTVTTELQTWADGQPFLQVSNEATMAAYLDGENGDYPMPLYPDILVNKIAAAHTVQASNLAVRIAKL